MIVLKVELKSTNRILASPQCCKCTINQLGFKGINYYKWPVIFFYLNIFTYTVQVIVLLAKNEPSYLNIEWGQTDIHAFPRHCYSKHFYPFGNCFFFFLQATTSRAGLNDLLKGTTVAVKFTHTHPQNEGAKLVLLSCFYINKNAKIITWSREGLFGTLWPP